MPATSLSLEFCVVIIFSPSVVCLFGFFKLINLFGCIRSLLQHVESWVVVNGFPSCGAWTQELRHKGLAAPRYVGS